MSKAEERAKEYVEFIGLKYHNLLVGSRTKPITLEKVLIDFSNQEIKALKAKNTELLIIAKDYLSFIDDGEPMKANVLDIARKILNT